MTYFLLTPPNLFISHNIILCNYLHHYNHKNNADNISTICVIPLMSSWNIYSIFFQSLLQIYSILKICYDILRYSTIPFLWRKMSVTLDFKWTFQYFQALYSVNTTLLHKPCDQPPFRSASCRLTGVALWIENDSPPFMQA